MHLHPNSQGVHRSVSRKRDAMNETIRNAVAEALGINPDALGCFTVMEHEGQPTVIVVHGGAGKGVYVETKRGDGDIRRFKKVA